MPGGYKAFGTAYWGLIVGFVNPDNRILCLLDMCWVLFIYVTVTSYCRRVFQQY